MNQSATLYTYAGFDPIQKPGFTRYDPLWWIFASTLGMLLTNEAFSALYPAAIHDNRTYS